MKLTQKQLKNIIIQEIKALRSELPPMKPIRFPPVEEAEMVKNLIAVAKESPEQALMLADALSPEALKFVREALQSNLDYLKRDVNYKAEALSAYADEESPWRFGPESQFEEAFEIAKDRYKEYRDFLKQFDKLINNK